MIAPLLDGQIEQKLDVLVIFADATGQSRVGQI